MIPAPVIRIILRYLTGPLLMIGLVLPEEQQAIIADPDIVAWVSTILGIIIPIVVERYYALARKYGWRT